MFANIVVFTAAFVFKVTVVFIGSVVFTIVVVFTKNTVFAVVVVFDNIVSVFHSQWFLCFKILLCLQWLFYLHWLSECMQAGMPEGLTDAFTSTRPTI